MKTRNFLSFHFAASALAVAMTFSPSYMSNASSPQLSDSSATTSNATGQQEERQEHTGRTAQDTELYYAQRKLEALQEDPIYDSGTIDLVKQTIRAHLEKTEDGITPVREERLNDVVEAAYLKAARHNLIALETDGFPYALRTIEMMALNIEEQLERAGDKADELEPLGDATGNDTNKKTLSTAEEREERLALAIKKACFASAIKKLEAFEVIDSAWDSQRIDITADTIHMLLDKAGEDVFTPEEIQSNIIESIKDRIDLATKKAREISARDKAPRFDP